jgi:hypothetical protein
MRVSLMSLGLMAVFTASCGGPASQNEAQPQVPDRNKVIPERWQKLFTDPTKLIAVLNQFELGNAPYAATGGSPAFVSRGKDLNLSYKRDKTSNSVNAVVSGPDANHVDSLVITFNMTDLNDRRRSNESFRKVLVGVLGRFDVNPEDPVKLAMASEKPIDTPILGAHGKVEKLPIPGADIKQKYRIVVTITPPRNTKNPPTQDAPARK